MEFNSNDVQTLKQFVQDVQKSVKSVALTLTDIKTNDDMLNGKLVRVETNCKDEIKNLSQKIYLFQTGIETISDQLKEISHNQIRLQCQLIKLNSNQNFNSLKHLRRSKSLDCGNLRPTFVNVAAHDSGININNAPIDLSDQESIKNKCQPPNVERFQDSNFEYNQYADYSRLKKTSFSHQSCIGDVENGERYGLVLELMENERSFCNSISLIQSHYYEPLKCSNLIPEEDVKFIFCDALFRLYEKHCILLHKVQELLSEWIDSWDPLLIELYSKTFTVHGSVARNYVFYSCAFNKIMELIQIYFVNDSSVMSFLQCRNDAYQNDRFTMKTISLTQLETCLKAPIISMERYISIFERLAASHNVGSYKICHMHKLINNFKKIKEDVQRSLRFSLSPSSCDNVAHVMKNNHKKKKSSSSSLLQRKNHACEMGINSTVTHLFAQQRYDPLDKCLEKIKKEKEKDFRPLNTASEPSLFAKPFVSYNAGGDMNVYNNPNLQRPKNRSSSNTDSARSMKNANLDRNVNNVRNTIAAFFSKRKNHQRFNETESLFGTWRRNKLNHCPEITPSMTPQHSGTSDAHHSGFPTNVYSRSPSVCSSISSKAIKTTNSSNRSVVMKTNVSINEKESCVIVGYAKTNSEKIQYLGESDDSIGVEI